MVGLRAVLVLGLLLAWGAGSALAADLPQAQLRQWIAEMKAADRGPFARIRWFCKDGTILPPKPYACGPHGGGVQHGEWSARTKTLRDHGYYIANVLADLDAKAFLAEPDHRERYAQLLIEQFLIARDDGWILRKARFYRGAFQEEDERRGARELLGEMARRPVWLGRDFLALRGGAALLRHGREHKSVGEVRQESAALAGEDRGFTELRNKIHARPDAGDAAAVRAYAQGVTNGALRARFDTLAATIEEVYGTRGAEAAMQALLRGLGERDAARPRLAEGAARLTAAGDAEARFALSAGLMALLRRSIAEERPVAARLLMLEASLALEREHFTAAAALQPRMATMSRRQRLQLLAASLEAIYGAGLISGRQLAALEAAQQGLAAQATDLARYKAALDYLGLVPGWGGQWLKFHFQAGMQKLAQLDPLAELFIQDLLRGSPLFAYSKMLDGLLRDANLMAGLRHELFGEEVGAGLRSLNPGLARGQLRLAPTDPEHIERDGIYLLPETVAELPPVAGILTAGEGNPLSHVQLLARNLGIPNVAVAEDLIERLRPYEGQEVVLAVSPAGSVRLFNADGSDIGLASAEDAAARVLIHPDLKKLDLERTEFLPLGGLRSEDSGRVVGPKAAKLGELKHHYPEAVTEGLAIPFGAFRRLLDQPAGADGTRLQWMVEGYRVLERWPEGSPEREAATEDFRKQLYAWIAAADPGPAFRKELRQAMSEQFGANGSYGVFVRSDTNVEDLPGFTGAGLNLTLPNVVGFDEVAAAIPRVWASPFAARAFAWRQSRMDRPEHVYPAVLLLKSVPVEKSGVLVTRDIDSGAPGWLSVAVNEGVGGAVDGQAAESLRINLESGEVKLLAQATAPQRRLVKPGGGVDLVPVSQSDRVLEPAEIRALIAFAKELPRRFPPIVDAEGKPAPADVEFGFLEGELKLFQIRPFLDSADARKSAYLASLDAGLKDLGKVQVDLAAPAGRAP